MHRACEFKDQTYKKTRTLHFSESFRKLDGCGCFRGLFGGSRGKLRGNPGKVAGKFFPNREMLQILGFRAPGKANPPGTLGPHCRDLVPTFRAGCFLKSTVPAFLHFSGGFSGLPGGHQLHKHRAATRPPSRLRQTARSSERLCQPTIDELKLETAAGVARVAGKQA